MQKGTYWNPNVNLFDVMWLLSHCPSVIPKTWALHALMRLMASTYTWKLYFVSPLNDNAMA